MDALLKIYEVHYELLVQYAAGCMRWQQREIAVEPEDLVQRALVLFVAGRIQWRGSVGLLLRSIKVAIRYLGRDVRRFHSRHMIKDFDEYLPAASRSAVSYRNPDRALLAVDTEAALGKLPPKMRLVARGYWILGKRAKDLALESGTTEATVRNHISRARRRLRLHLRPYLRE